MTSDGPTGDAALDCLAVVTRLWDYLDGRLTPDEVRALDAHLDACAACPPHFEFERAFLAAVSASRAEERDVTTIRERVLTALQARGFVAP
ncbi:MAG: hypothetical protein AVDCRST_MAG40-3241 [uncultured Gemmatimonadaceae bacterium]|uniref:Putative zinc-finger domain-containing protein n=1 Tax=uncultured Gemmatimonadaceae bacterium TaxID=246130 RepID=A0A6J4ME80_9BACT|nr:MAG: hypothetical protein AVDCRST_MAG40-3241 [uncultured Gemmatimonadaceae bacterium]